MSDPVDLARLPRGLRIACPVCGRGPGEACADPRGNWLRYLHRSRGKAFLLAAGPTWRVWTSEPDPDPASSYWRLDLSVNLPHDADGSQAKAAAHAWARRLRSTYPCLVVAVRPAGSKPKLLPRWQP